MNYGLRKGRVVLKASDMKAKTNRFLGFALTFVLFFGFTMTAVLFHANAASVVARGDCGAQGDNVKWVLNSKGTLTIKGYGEMMDYDSYDERPWEWYGDSIYEVVIQYGVTSIGAYSFYECAQELTSVSIEDSVKTIGKYAFFQCLNLSSLSIPNSVTTIGASAFWNCNGLKTVKIPNSVKEIEWCAFSACHGLKKIKVSSNNKVYSSDETGCLFNKKQTVLVAYPAGNERTTYTIPYNVTAIEEGAFYASDILLKIKVEKGNKYFSSDETGCLYNKDKTAFVMFPFGNEQTLNGGLFGIAIT